MTEENARFAPIRGEIRVEERPGDAAFPAVLIDPVLEQRIKLDALGLRLVRALTEPRTRADFEALLADESVPGEPPAAPGKIAALLGGFERLCLLDDPRAARTVAERRRTLAWLGQPAEAIPLHFLPEARFDCTGCGGCCGGHNVGPVDGHVVDHLASEEGQAFLVREGLADQELYVRNAADLGGELERVISLRTVGGWCLFLHADNRCRVHGAFGAAAKPSVCRLFPLAFVLRPDGVAVSLQVECRDILDAARVGRPLSDQKEEIRTLLGLPQDLERVRPTVLIDGLATLGYADWATLRQALLAAAEPLDPDPVATLGTFREVVDRVGRPLAEGTPAQVERLATTAELRDTLHETVQALGRGLVELRRSLADEDERRIIRLTSLDRVLGGLSRLVPALERVLRPPQDPEARGLFRLLARNALHGEEVSASQRIRHGLTVLALRWILARAIAVDRAHDVKRPEPNAQDHIDGLVAIDFCLRSPRTRDLVHKLSHPLSLVFYDHLTDIAQHAAAIAVVDYRAEVFAS